MKLLLVPALLMAALPGSSAPVTFEAGGIRVGAELVTGQAISLRDAGAAPLLVSGSVVESLSGENLPVVLGGKTVVLGAGLRLARTAEGFRISTHGVPFAVESAGRSISAERTLDFTVTEAGFDFGALGALAGGELQARVSAAAAPAVAADPLQEGTVEVSPEKRDRVSRKIVIRRLYSGDPLAPGRAVDSVSVRLIPRATPDGAP